MESSFLMRIAAATSIFLVLLQGVAVRGAAPFADGYGKSMLADQGARLESEVANLMERRGEPGDLTGPLLELQIDLRIVDRLLYLAAADAQPQSDLQICCALRAISFASTGKQIGQLLQSARGPLAESQLEGMRKFHEMTYSLPEVKSIGNVDQICHDAGVALFIAAGPLASGLKDLPMMRPAPIDSGPAPPVASTPPKLTDLAARAEKLGVSTPLRRQLLALAASAAAPRPPDAGPALTDALDQAIELADGIAHNTALDVAARPKMETQLAESLALFSDVRTRGAGRARLQTLGRYHQTLERIRRLKLNPELQERLAPAFLWIQQNPDAGGKVFETIERYLGLCSRFDGRKAASSLAPNQRKLVDDMSRQFSAHRSAFLDIASQLSGPAVLRRPIRSRRTPERWPKRSARSIPSSDSRAPSRGWPPTSRSRPAGWSGALGRRSLPSPRPNCRRTMRPAGLSPTSKSLPHSRKRPRRSPGKFRPPPRRPGPPESWRRSMPGGAH